MGFPGSTQQRKTCLLAALLVGAACTSSHADDIDVYKSRIAKQQKPNILFVLDYSGSMAWDTSGIDWSESGTSRISVLKNAMNQILDSNEGKINAGLGSQFADSATGIGWPISDLRADASTIDPDIPANTFTVKEIIKQRIGEREADGATATVDALVEAAQYFRGDKVTHNDAPLTPDSRHQPSTWDATEQRYVGGNGSASIAASYSPSNAWTSDTSQTFYCNDYSQLGGPNFCAGKNASNCSTRSESDTSTEGYSRINNLWGDYRQCEYARTDNWETPRYNSPIVNSCDAQTNAIILITDGEPTTVNNGTSLKSIVGDDLSACEDLETRIFSTSEHTSSQGNCAKEIAYALANNTVNPSIPDSAVTTYTVGFNINGPGQTFLNEVAQSGGGVSYDAQTPEDLNAALTAAVEDIRSGSQNFTGLSVDVDRSSFSHGDRVYYNLFTPSTRRAWNGNVKGYFVDGSGLLDIAGNRATENNKFKDTAQSFWSAQADGDKVSEGGASEQLLTGTRNLYTFVGDTIPSSGAALATNDTMRLRSSNTLLTNSLLGLGDDAAATSRRTAALDWIQNAPMGAPLHTKSVTVTYANNLRVLYTMTNQGLLHAIDASAPVSRDPVDDTGGDELFAFMPKRLLKNLPDLHVNTSGVSHIYGLDGPITRWHDDINKDGVVNNSEKVMLYFGMRRGGTAYYAMNVSVPSSPKLEWVIDADTDGFDRIAQSWSRMSLIKVKQGEDTKRALVFGGGYDAAAQDDVNAPAQSKGNAIYMVDENGELLLTIDSSDHGDMKYSIASDLAVIDSDGDQLADRLYVGDLGGQIWRVDFEDLAEDIEVTKLADLSDDYHQPFFYPPSVSINGKRGKRFLSITIGSGNRTNPLLTGVQNNFYMIRDTDVDKGPPSDDFSQVTENNLYDATDNNIQSTDQSVATTASNSLRDARGWRVKLSENEKSLSGVLAYEGKIMATTFKATSLTEDNEVVCNFEPTGKFYVMDINDASILNSSLDDDISEEQGGEDAGTDSDTPPSRYLSGETIDTQGIASAPVPILAKGSDTVQIFVDKEPVAEYDRALSRVYWLAR